jgi:hypothetical protein
MKKIAPLLFVDLFLVVFFLSVLITGLIKFPGLLSSLGLGDVVLPMKLITNIHDNSGVMFALFVVLHVLLSKRNMKKGLFCTGDGE